MEIYTECRKHADDIEAAGDTETAKAIRYAIDYSYSGIELRMKLACELKRASEKDYGDDLNQAIADTLKTIDAGLQ